MSFQLLASICNTTSVLYKKDQLSLTNPARRLRNDASLSFRKCEEYRLSVRPIVTSTLNTLTQPWQRAVAHENRIKSADSKQHISAGRSMPGGIEQTKQLVALSPRLFYKMSSLALNLQRLSVVH